MYLFSWANNGIKKLNWYHMSLTKVSVFAATLLLVKFFPNLTSLDWYWYLILVLVSAIPVWMRMTK